MSSANGSPRRRIVGTSFKMYMDINTSLTYIRDISSLSSLAQSKNIDLFVIPDFVTLLPAKDLLKNTHVRLGAQDAFWEDSGAYTGEVSPKTLAQAGVSIVILGHAERRRLFHETDAQVGKKAAAVVRNGLVPLVCVGEKTHGNIASAAVGMAIEECRPQVKAVLDSVPDEAEVIIAYEPVWAIGASEPAGPDHVVAVTQHLRKMVEGRKGLTRILYGGSAGPGTFEKLEDGVDGLFLGRFGHNIKNLEKVINEMGV